MDALLDQVTELHCEAPLPSMVRVRQHFDAPVLESIEAGVRAQLRLLEGKIRPGMRVGITAGSRGVANIAAILRATGDVVRELGGRPFIIPAMGSHGGATAEGQVEVLAGYGVTEATTGLSIVSSMAVRQIGTLGDAGDAGPAVYLSETALEADGLIICNRVKPHTDFRGPIESGLAKILAIGLGKHQGAKTIHAFGTRGLAHWMPRAARLIVGSTNVLCGLAILENAYDQTARVVGVPPEAIGAEGEAALLQEAGRLMASLPFDEIDVLIVDEIGKNVSGTGMDTNIVGRMMIDGVPEFRRPHARIVVVLDLAEASHGNGIGTGLADVMTVRAARKLDLRTSYINALTSGIGGVQRVKLPMFLPSDVDAISAGILCCGRGDPAQARVVRIKNTLEIGELEVSESLLEEVRANSRLEVIGAAQRLPFDAEGNLPRQAPMPAAH
ncbi:MAG TPA: DUF2088 domain-containing protein [Chloroflexota bacterium]|nr:DUF2088 domain-containing protein [Chloroflexota bacterium]